MGERGQVALYAVTLVAAFAVGILVGRSACAPEPEVKIREKIVEREIPAPCPDVCEPGGPDAGPEETTAPASGGMESNESEALPEGPPAPDPAARKRLLAHVRDESVRLQPCRPGSMTETRITVTLRVSKSGSIEEVSINAPSEQLPGRVLDCIRGRIREWTLPSELIPDRREIVFGLEL